jgi:hypothetical protein
MVLEMDNTATGVFLRTVLYIMCWVDSEIYKEAHPEWQLKRWQGSRDTRGTFVVTWILYNKMTYSWKQGNELSKHNLEQ